MKDRLKVLLDPEFAGLFAADAVLLAALIFSLIDLWDGTPDYCCFVFPLSVLAAFGFIKSSVEAANRE